MAYPTLACKYVALYHPAWGHSEPAPLQFNQITIRNFDGTWNATFNCDPLYSTFLPAYSPDWITPEIFAELWPLLLGMIIVAFGIRLVRRMFDHGV